MTRTTTGLSVGGTEGSRDSFSARSGGSCAGGTRLGLSGGPEGEERSGVRRSCWILDQIEP